MSASLKFKLGISEPGFKAGGFFSQRLMLPSVLGQYTARDRGAAGDVGEVGADLAGGGCAIDRVTADARAGQEQLARPARPRRLWV